jgi:F-type H+-transporting ATPase subunit b
MVRALVILVIGLGLAVGGYYLSVNPPAFLAFQETLQHQGIPLDLGKTIAMIGMFLVLFPLLRMFYFAPLGEAINRRTHELESTFEEAESLRAEMGKMRSEYEQRLAQTEQQARDQIQAQIREAQQLRDSMRAEAVQQAEEYKRRAIEEIEAEKQKLMADLRLGVVNLTLMATEKLVGQSVDSETNRRLVEDFIEKVEAPN